MNYSNPTFSRVCLEISKALLYTTNNNKNIQTIINKICKKYSIFKIPRKYEILSVVKNEDFIKLRKILVKKPIKTASGVAVVAVMPKPYGCPHGRCTYCPGGVEFNSPNSYTGKEPITSSAIKNNYDPKKQIYEKLENLSQCGHDISKIELVIIGGTFLFMPKPYQENFIKLCYDALNGYTSTNLENSKINNEKASIRNVGFTIETKPDYCKNSHIDLMLKYGITRIELGVQNLQNNTYKITNRGHNFLDVADSFHKAKDSGFKIVAHMMPGLPGTTPKQDAIDFIKLFTDPRFKPDMLKIYPTLILKNTKLYEHYVGGKYKPYSNTDMIKLIIEIKKHVPRWIRIMRIQREISQDEIVAGLKSGNLRQIINKVLKRQNIFCKCIRCREIGLTNNNSILEKIKLNREDYFSSDGHEIFLSYDDYNDRIFGFLRLRHTSNKSYKNEMKNCCIVRELHVYGKLVDVGKKTTTHIQHSGLGKNLLKNAEKISQEEFDVKKILVISSVGSREYYKKLGYHLNGFYMEKKLT